MLFTERVSWADEYSVIKPKFTAILHLKLDFLVIDIYLLRRANVIKQTGLCLGLLAAYLKAPGGACPHNKFRVLLSDTLLHAAQPQTLCPVSLNA